MKYYILQVKEGIYSYDVPWFTANGGPSSDADHDVSWVKTIEKYKRSLALRSSYNSLRILTIEIEDEGSKIISDEIFTVPLKVRTEINKPEELPPKATKKSSNPVFF